jgi:predicted metalloenzyme YecM
MIRSYEQFVENSLPYLKVCEQFLTQYSLQGKVIVDHICYKCKSSAEYQRMRAILESNPPSLYFYQVYLASRRVAYMKLQNGLPITGGTVNFVELADKKQAEEKVLGFHHVEIYPVPNARMGVAGSYSNLVRGLEQRKVKLELKERPHHTTHDILVGKFIIRLTDKPLIQKIVQEEMRL